MREPKLPAWLSTALERDPIVFIDVGARGGWQRKWRAFSRHVNFIGFEPDTVECQRLQKGAKENETFVARGLGRKTGQVPLYHCEPAVRTSLYRPNQEVIRRVYDGSSMTRVVEVESISITTMDAALSDLGSPVVDFVKLDTQGSELDILAGGPEVLAGPLLGVELEVEFVQLYENQPLFPEVCGFLNALDYEFADFPRSYTQAWMRFGNRPSRGHESFRDFVGQWAALLRAPGGALRGGQRLVYADAIFLRVPGAWVTAVLACGVDARAHALRGLLTCCILGYYDHARELAQGCHAAGLLSADELTSFAQFIDESSRLWFRAFEDAARTGRKLVNRFRQPAA